MRLIWIAVLLGAVAAQAADPQVDVRVLPQADGSRVLLHEAEIPAPVAQVWDAFTTAEGFGAWAVPFARVDFRLGGEIESSYRLDAAPGDEGNIRNRILAYVPQRMIALQAVAAPPGFAHAELLPELFSVIEFETLPEERTRLRLYGVGYREGEGFEVLQKHFHEGNRWSLAQLVRRFEHGPVDWNALLGGAAPADTP